MKNDLIHRPRRLRKNKNMRRMFRENHLHIDDLIYPIFIVEGVNIKKPIKSMPDIFQWSLDRVNEEIDRLLCVGINRIILFGIPLYKDDQGKNSYKKTSIIPKSIAKLKKEYSNLIIITDLCLCSYTSNGHCGILKNNELDNDFTLELLEKQAISHAQAGVDIVAPSGMIDGMVKYIRFALDKRGFSNIPIMSYSVKYASSLYGPFRDAANSSPKFGNRKSYQMNICNRLEAIKEVKLDIEEGADIIMVKPALAYLDIIREIRQCTFVPIACYNVSGEYSMVKAASLKGWIDHDRVMMEMLLSMKRAGADIIITYFAYDVAKILNINNEYK